MDAFFTIIVPTRNRPRQLAACLEALAQLKYPRDRYEVVVVDDGGETPLDEVIAPWHEKMNLTLAAQPQAGPARARNTGAARARGEFLAFTDDDCAPAPDWLTNFATQFRATPDNLLGGQIVNGLPDNPYSTASQLLISYLYKYYNPDPQRARFFTSNNMAVTAQRFREVGGFDEKSMRAAGEDRELCDRWRHRGSMMTYVADAVVRHAHALTLWQFWQQHFTYGRGAYYFHKTRAQRGAGRIRVEPRSFYMNLLRFPFEHMRGARAAQQSALLFISQAANAAGFFWERWTR